MGKHFLFQTTLQEKTWLIYVRTRKFFPEGGGIILYSRGSPRPVLDNIVLCKFNKFEFRGRGVGPPPNPQPLDLYMWYLQLELAIHRTNIQHKTATPRTASGRALLWQHRFQYFMSKTERILIYISNRGNRNVHLFCNELSKLKSLGF